jgi:hypothetical protein
MNLQSRCNRSHALTRRHSRKDANNNRPVTPIAWIVHRASCTPDQKESVMMLPFRRRPTSQKPLPKDANTNAKASEAPPVEADHVDLHHLDYNHEPVNVGSLSHYIAPTVDERFRVH